MKRLTVKDEREGAVVPYNAVDVSFLGNAERLNKLGRLEDLEDTIGCDLSYPLEILRFLSVYFDVELHTEQQMGSTNFYTACFVDVIDNYTKKSVFYKEVSIETYRAFEEVLNNEKLRNNK